MRLTYFQPPLDTLDQLKTQYRGLAKRYHPDLGGTTRQMQEVNSEYAYLLANYAKQDAWSRQQSAHVAGKKSAADYHNIDTVAETLRKKIEAALNLDGVTVELCGLWIWITGNTKKHRETLGSNGLGFKWARDKCAWFYAGVPSYNHKPMSLDKIRHTYGSQVFKRNPQPTTEED